LSWKGEGRGFCIDEDDLLDVDVDIILYVKAG
jgi:hypothetical protein